MKKFKRILFCILITCFLFFGLYILLEVFKSFHFNLKIKTDPYILIPIHLTFFSFVSLLYNVNKFQKQLVFEAPIYKILRIGDIIYSISIFIFSVVCIYFTIDNLKISTLQISRQIIFFTILLVLFFLSILLFFDSIFFHKEQKNILKKDFIDEIGQ